MTRKKAKAAPPANLTIVYRDVDSLQEDPRNARHHPPKQLEELAASITKYGFTKPVALKPDEKTIGAGNGAWRAAQLAGLKQVPTIVLNLSDKDWTAYAILDNRIPLNAEWNLDILREDLGLLAGAGYDLGSMGFDKMELGNLGIEGFTLPERLDAADETPPPPANPVVKLGELWILGKHRLICGDSTDKKTVDRLLDGAKPPLMATDPPYGVNYDPTWRMKAGVSKNTAKMGKVSNDDRADWTPAWKLFPGDVAYVWHGGLHAGTVQNSLKASGFDVRSQIIWNKDRFALGRSDYHWRHEPCWYAVREGRKGNWQADRKQDTVWNIPARDDGGHGHGTQKPIECMRRPILNNTKPGEGVYEPFSGSGTTLIACEMEGRIAFAIELNPAYVEVAIERWEKQTGLTAKREDGKTLTELRKKGKRNGK